MKTEINADDIRQWYKAQTLVYASATVGNYSIRLTISDFSDCPTYEVTKRHVNTLVSKELYRGGDINAAVRTFNEAV